MQLHVQQALADACRTCMELTQKSISLNNDGQEGGACVRKQRGELNMTEVIRVSYASIFFRSTEVICNCTFSRLLLMRAGHAWSLPRSL